MKKRMIAILLAVLVTLGLVGTGFRSAPVTAVEPMLTLSFSLHKTAVKLAVGKTATLSLVNVMPDASFLEGRTQTWSSSNDAVVKMTNHPTSLGQIRAISDGVAVITCEVAGYRSSCTVTVGTGARNIPVESFVLNESSLPIQVGEKVTLSICDVLPTDATNLDKAKWFNKNPDVLSGEETPGMFTAVKAGYTTITCQIGSVKAYCKVYISDVSAPTPNPTPTPIPTPPPTTQEGWVTIGQDVYYYGSDGLPLTGWQSSIPGSEGKTYYFADDGVMVNGWWQGPDGTWYYFSPDWGMTIGWKNNIDDWGNEWFYFEDDGSLVTGWKYDIPGWENEWFYFDTNGLMYQSEWFFSNGNWYYATASGAIARNTYIDGYWVGPDGIFVR